MRLFTVFGIDVFLHWSWLLVAIIQYQIRSEMADPLWHLATYVSLFGIVLLHELGHSLACRSVGGQANQIVLWPLGGIAYVRPPQRPGATLWSIAAGPLVNVALVPVTILAWVVVIGDTGMDQWNRAQWYVASVAAINIGLLIFNMLPIYPLDGGQIVQSILWFFIGRARSLMITASFGLLCAIILGIVMLLIRDYWLVIMALFVGMQAWRGMRMARALATMESMEAERWGQAPETYRR